MTNLSSSAISARAAQARETARSYDGKFGHQAHDRADGIDLAGGHDSELADRLGWDPHTADPTEFDGHLAQLNGQVGQQRRILDGRLGEVHRVARDQKHWEGRRQVWGMTDSDALAAARARAAAPHELTAIDEHASVVAAIAAGQPDAAAEAQRRHISHAYETRLRQQAQLLADRAGRHVQLLRGGMHGPKPAKGFEDLQRAQRGKLSHGLAPFAGR